MTQRFVVEPVGWVRSDRAAPIDDDWKSVVSSIELTTEQVQPDAVAGLAEFSHLEIVFVFDRVDPAGVERGSRHPRGNPDWPRVGILAQRGKDRPNRLGLCTCELLGVDGLRLQVRGLDAIDGSPVLDIKPFFTEFAPRSEVRQPKWSRELMRGYW